MIKFTHQAFYMDLQVKQQMCCAWILFNCCWQIKQNKSFLYTKHVITRALEIYQHWSDNCDHLLFSNSFVSRTAYKVIQLPMLY